MNPIGVISISLLGYLVGGFEGKDLPLARHPLQLMYTVTWRGEECGRGYTECGI